MAKPTAPLLSFGASGTVAKTAVYSKWKGRQYVRRHVIPANPNTVDQQSTRNAFRVANDIWKVAPALLVAPWTSYAQGQVLTDRNAFMGFYVRENRGEADLTNLVFSPGAKGGLPALTAIVTPGSEQLSVAITAPTPPTGWTLQAAIAAAIRDGDPETTTFVNITAAEDLSDPYAPVLTGLTASQLYIVGAWLRWLKPDGGIAYGASILTSGTPTA